MVQLLAEVTGILYARAANRTPRMGLHLSLALWRHYCYLHELFKSLNTVTLGTLYGGYFHNVLHSPLQLMLVSLRSTNTENLERLQRTARRIGKTITSRRASEVPRTVRPRGQAELKGELHQATEKKETGLSRLGQELPPVRNTILERKLLRDVGMNANFEGLLKTISLFLRCGKGVWWDYVGTHIMFLTVTVNQNLAQKKRTYVTYGRRHLSYCSKR